MSERYRDMRLNSERVHWLRRNICLETRGSGLKFQFGGNLRQAQAPAADFDVGKLASILESPSLKCHVRVHPALCRLLRPNPAWLID